MSDIYHVAIKYLDRYDIAHFGTSLFLRKTNVSQKIINKFVQKEVVREFTDDVDGDIWYDVPFAYPAGLTDRT